MVILGVSGGSGSGKSWLASYLKKRLGRRAEILCQDWYYRDNSHLTPRQAKRLNFDHPRAIETRRLLRDLETLRSGRAVKAPVYDYATHSRLKGHRIVRPAPLVILDGLFVLNERAVFKQLDLSVYIDVPEDLRLIRRLRRDVEERRVDLEETLRLYEHCVRPMHLRFIKPAAARATWVWKQEEDRGFPRRLYGMLAAKLRASKR